jgi:purine-binding chemotaxis protein CheW
MLTISLPSRHQTGASEISSHMVGVDTETRSFLTFKVAGHIYAVNLLQIREVRTASVMTRVAHAPNYVVGVTSIRGEIIPVIDLKKRFGLETKHDEIFQGLILISELENRKVGIQVDNVMDVSSLDMRSIQPVPSTTMAIDLKYLLGMTQIDDQLVLLVDLQKILQPEELHAVSQVAEEAALS